MIYISAVFGFVVGYVVAALGIFPDVHKNVQKLKPIKIADIVKEQKKTEGEK